MQDSTIRRLLVKAREQNPNQNNRISPDLFLQFLKTEVDLAQYGYQSAEAALAVLQNRK